MMIFDTYTSYIYFIFISLTGTSRIMLDNSSYNGHHYFLSNFKRMPIGFHCKYVVYCFRITFNIFTSILTERFQLDI